MTIDSNIIDTTGGAAAEGRGPLVLSIALESMVMVFDCPCLALEAQLIQNLFNKPLMKFGTLRWCAQGPQAQAENQQNGRRDRTRSPKIVQGPDPAPGPSPILGARAWGPLAHHRKDYFATSRAFPFIFM